MFFGLQNLLLNCSNDIRSAGQVRKLMRTGPGLGEYMVDQEMA